VRAPLPSGAGQGSADRLDQAAVGVGGDQADAGEAAGNQVSEEREPAGAVLSAAHLQAEDLPVAVGVHPGREQGVDVHRATTLPHLHHQRVGGDEGVRPGVQRSSAERLHLAIEISGHLRDLRLGQPGNAEGLDKLLHPARRHAEQIGGGDHADQGGLGPPASLQQPLREVAALPQPRDGQIDRPGPGVPTPAPVTVTGVAPLGAALA
jgi:hypothetical protein